MSIVKGRTPDQTGLLEKETRTYDLLDELGLEYWTLQHPAAYTMEDCLAVDQKLGTRMCKNLFLCNRQKTKFFLLMMPDDKPFKTKELSPQAGSSRLSFADGEYMNQYLDISPGALSILGLANDRDNCVQLLVDEDLLEEAYIGCHPCVNTASVKLHTKDLFGPFLQAVHHTMLTVHLTGMP